MAATIAGTVQRGVTVATRVSRHPDTRTPSGFPNARGATGSPPAAADHGRGAVLFAGRHQGVEPAAKVIHRGEIAQLGTKDEEIPALRAETL